MKTVVVTGASAGLGRAIAEAFAARGDQVALLARDRDRLDIAADAVAAAGGRAVAIPTDVAEFAEVGAAADRVESELGPIDAWSTTRWLPCSVSSATSRRRSSGASPMSAITGTSMAHAPRSRGWFPVTAGPSCRSGQRSRIG